MAKQKWSDLTTVQKRVVYLVSAAEMVMTVAASRDLAKRPSDMVRGSKTAWALALLVQPVGPMAYFAAARR